MIRIGLVDLDTSHPLAFTNILRTMAGVEVTALWDGHDVREPGYDRRFASANGIPVVCAALEEMPAHVDAAMIHGVNWDLHCDRALVFLKAKIPVLIDKPVVGSVRDCDRLMEMREKYGTPVFGGSALRFAREVAALRSEAARVGRVDSVVASGPGDFFSYGIHTTEMLQGFAGTGIRSVRPVSRGGTPVLAVEYDDGPAGFLQLEMGYYQWSLAAYTSAGLRTAVVSPEGLYEPFLGKFVAFLKGGEPGDALAGPLEAVRVHLAAEIALRSGSGVALGSLPSGAGFDGRAFAEEYAAAKRREAQAGPPA